MHSKYCALRTFDRQKHWAQSNTGLTIESVSRYVCARQRNHCTCQALASSHACCAATTHSDSTCTHDLWLQELICSKNAGKEDWVSSLAEEPASVGCGRLQQHIGGFEITVHDPQAVQVRHASGNVQQRLVDAQLRMATELFRSASLVRCISGADLPQFRPPLTRFATSGRCQYLSAHFELVDACTRGAPV